MPTNFKVGDHVRWNSEAGHVSGKIVQVHKKDIDYEGYTHHASADDPQYEIKSDKPTISRCTKAPRCTRLSDRCRRQRI